MPTVSHAGLLGGNINAARGDISLEASTQRKKLSGEKKITDQIPPRIGHPGLVAAVVLLNSA